MLLLTHSLFVILFQISIYLGFKNYTNMKITGSYCHCQQSHFLTFYGLWSRLWCLKFMKIRSSVIHVTWDDPSNEPHARFIHIGNKLKLKYQTQTHSKNHPCPFLHHLKFLSSVTSELWMNVLFHCSFVHVTYIPTSWSKYWI